MAENDKILIGFLNKCGIIFDDFNNINGLLVPREIFTSEEKYDAIKKKLKK